jgi:hypothetical protein
VQEGAIDPSQSGTLYAGQAMKMVSSNSVVPIAGDAPTYVACTANSDVCQGFIVFDIKNQGYAKPGTGGQLGAQGTSSRFELAKGGCVMYLYATGAIPRGAQVCLDVSSPGGVQATGNSAEVVGSAIDGATASGQLIRVELKTPSFATA